MVATLARLLRRPMHSVREGDEGFTMVEVVVSLFLLAVVMSGALSLFVRSMSAAALQTQRQQALHLADSVLEDVRGLPAGTLVTGRTLTAVSALWASPGIVSTAGTVKTYDLSATASSVPTVALTRTTTVGNTAYTIKVFIDTCYASAVVTGTSGVTSCGATASATTSAMYRIAVGVTWTPGRGRTCSGGVCGYSVFSFVDNNLDPTFGISTTVRTHHEDSHGGDDEDDVYTHHVDDGDDDDVGVDDGHH